jgi:hypothetical protein
VTKLRAALARIPLDVRLFLPMLAVLVALRVRATSSIKWMLIDGGYYMEVARHVRDGLGLTSHASLYHAGYEQFPHPTTVYPLWPIVHGMLGRVFDLEMLAHWLPSGFYVTAVVAAFVFGRRLWPEPVFPNVLPGLHAGHVAALGMGLQRDFVVFTAVPYTEGVSWTLLYLFLWRALGKSGSLSLAWGVEIGVWLALLYFGRFQLVVVGMGVALALGLRVLVGPDRGKALLHALVAMGVYGACIGAWFLHIRGFVDEAGLSSLLRFDQNRANDLLSGFDVIVPHTSLWKTLLDRLNGFGIAWSPANKSNYWITFHTLHLALPFAIPFAVAGLARLLRGEGFRGLLDRLRRPEAFGQAAVWLVALGGLASVHLIHKHYNGEWYFAKRQGMMSLLAFVVPLAWLLRRRTPLATLLGAVVLASTAVTGTKFYLEHALATGGETRGPDRYPNLVSWLRARDAASDETVVVVMGGGEVYKIAWRTEDVGYHWIFDKTTYADLRAMTDRLGARYVILTAKQATVWRPFKEGAARFGAEFVELPERPDNFLIFERRTEPAPPLPPQRALVVGIGGLAWKVLSPMMERGELPAFARLTTGGAGTTELEPAGSLPAIAVPGAEAVTVGWPGGDDHATREGARAALARVEPLDREATATALSGWGDAPLLLLGLRGPDRVQDLAWDTFEPFRYKKPSTDRGVVEAAYRAADALLAEAMASVDEDTTLFVMSSHGPAAADSRGRKEPATHGGKGVLFAWGPNVRPGARITAEPRDLAPTLAWILGAPDPDAKAGRVLAEAFTRPFAARLGSPLPYDEPEPAAVDEAALEDLQTDEK